MRTKAGIGWTKDTLFGNAKLLVGSWAIKRGNTTDGLFTQSSQNRLVQLACDTLEGFHEEYTKHSLHSGDMGRVLAGRAEFCLPCRNNEISRFLQPDWEPTYRLVTEAGLGERTRKLRKEEMWECQEKRLKLAVCGQPGVYIRIDPSRPEDGYVGSGTDVSKRGTRCQGAMMLVAVITTSGVKEARNLESNIIAMLSEMSGKWSRGRGFFRLPPGHNFVETVLAYMRQHQRSYLRHTVVMGDYT